MAIYRIVNRLDGSKTMVRHILETASEHPLTDLEEIVNELLDQTEQRQVITNADSESALNEYAKKCKEDFTKPSGIAMGWRACYEWIIDKNTTQRQVTDAMIEKWAKGMRLCSFDDCINVTQEAIRISYEAGLRLGAKVMRDGKIKSK